VVKSKGTRGKPVILKQRKVFEMSKGLQILEKLYSISEVE